MQRALSQARQLSDKTYRGKFLDFYNKAQETGCVSQIGIEGAEYRLLTSNCASYIEDLLAIFGMNCTSRLKVLSAVQTPSCTLELPGEPKGDLSAETEKVIKFLQKHKEISSQLDTLREQLKLNKEGKTAASIDDPPSAEMTNFCQYMQIHKPQELQKKMATHDFTLYIIELWSTRSMLWHTCMLIIFDADSTFATLGGWPERALLHWPSLERAISGDHAAKELSTAFAVGTAVVSVGAYSLSLMYPDDPTFQLHNAAMGLGTISASTWAASAYMQMAKSESPFCVCMWDPVLEMYRRKGKYILRVNAVFNSKKEVLVKPDLTLTKLIQSPFLQNNVQNLIEAHLQSGAPLTLKSLLIHHMEDLNLDINKKYSDSDAVLRECNRLQT